MTTSKDQVRAYYAAVDANDLDKLVALFAAGATYRRPGYEPIVGTHALRRFYEKDRVIAHGTHTLTSVVADGTRVAVAGRFEGRSKTDEALQVEFADFFTFADETIVERVTFFHVAAV